MQAFIVSSVSVNSQGSVWGLTGKVSPCSDCKTNRSASLNFLTKPTVLSVRETDWSDGAQDKADTALGPIEVGSFGCWGDHLFDPLANNTCDPRVCGGKGGRVETGRRPQAQRKPL